MSKIELHAPFTTFSGTVGKLVYRKVRGKTVVALKPDADRPLSQAEADHRQVFSKAAAWATVALKSEALRQFYEALGKQREIPARAAAVSDFLKRPSLEDLDISSYTGQTGSRILFRATDNVGVISTLVTITDTDGNLLEDGAAVEVDPATGTWMYTAQNIIPAGTVAVINVAAYDRPGNKAALTQEKTL
jgi:hypothetical protein